MEVITKGESLRQTLIDLELDQKTIQCCQKGWEERTGSFFGEPQLIRWVEQCFQRMHSNPWSAELVVRKETKNFPIEGHEHPNRKSSVFLKTWLGEPTLLKSGPVPLGETVFITNEWHAAPDTKEPRLVTLLYCQFEEDQF